MSRSKPFRLLCLLFSFIVCFAGFGLNSFAATNLINPDFFQWDNTTTNMSPTGEELMNVALVGDNIYRLTPTYLGNTGTDNSMAVYMGWAIDLTYLRTGDSYTFTCYLPSPSELRSLTSYNHTDEYFANWVGQGYSIGFGSVNEDGQLEVILDFLNITKDNYLSLAGKKFVHSFECPDYSASNPGIYIWSYNDWATSQLFIEGSMSLVNNSAEDEEGFFSRLFEWFQEKFDNISNSFSDLGGKISTGLSGLGDRISNFFVNLGESISSGLTNVKEGLQSKLDDVKNKIGQIQTWLTDLKNDLLQGIKDLFVPDQAFLNNFKTNVSKIFSDSLGFAYDISTFVGDVFDKLISILGTNASGTFSFTFPGLEFDFLGYHIELWDDITLSFAFLNTIPGFSLMYSLYKVSLHGMCIFLLAGYGLKIYDGVVDSK